ncbi:EthD family reductase [Rossellomorea sp. AcN35-11]|nr:EthD family reductase [Rossellomorea aquimaris]WJV28132.1 EthD family reductase [Rossellomorea sp. AcN35-11]
MAKVIVMYEKPKDQEGFEEYYVNSHMPIAGKVPHVKDAKVQKVLSNQNTDLELYLVTEIEFEDKAAMKEAFATEEWKAVGADVPNLMKYLEKPPIITIVDE